MTSYDLAPERRTLHGHFSRDLAPALTIDSGDTVRFTTLDVAWGEPAPAGATVGLPPPDLRRDPLLDRGHALTGPVFVRGAVPGTALEVRIGAIRPGPWGTTWTSRRLPWYADLGIGERTTTRWTLDADRARATNERGHAVRTRPFLGIMGNAPGAPGIHATTPPRAVGGNMDCRELVSGSTLWLPVEVAGALFSAGDGHAAQGDGEVAGTALEAPFEVADLTFVARPDLRLRAPRALTPAGWVTLGFGATLDEAVAGALDGMLDLIVERYAVDRDAALALASLVVDLRVTQIVNQVVGAHAVLAPDAIALGQALA